MVTLETPVELDRSQFSQNSVVIRSTKDITVLAKSKRNDIEQLLVLQPVNSLGSLYYIPTLGLGEGSQNLLGYKDFYGARGKIVIINSEKKNTVKVNFNGENSKQELEPFWVFQVNVSDSLPVNITAQHDIVVLLTHPCSNTTICQCQMVVTQIRPTNTWGTTFVVPSAFNNTADSTPHLIVTSDQGVTFNSTLQIGTGTNSPYSVSHLVYDLKTQYLNSSKHFSVTLIQPGHISELTPVSSFSACYLLPEKTSISKALVIAPTLNVSQVYVGKDQISSEVEWKTVDSQPYSWAMIDLPSGEHRVIWHPSTKIGVYVKDGENWSEAISITTEPALQGCLLDRARYSVMDQSGTWAEMVGHCQQENGELLSINNEGILRELSQSLSNPSKQEEVWVGLRRRLLNGEWYWLNKQPMNITKWFQGQPGSSEDKFCASMSLSSDNNENFRWTSRSCCHVLKPVCYKHNVYFPLAAPTQGSI
ncbi:uncharacterized protein LOC121720898 [Alosa sapidissima]|uniref:uncharacterized protein LOC121720898 n=1 Tax=Alosa sapidissima TaxID=34773 RepID=UPI001C0A4321|nr:uncharacterized protein LOC121720898 [Alosa sapidissima]